MFKKRSFIFLVLTLHLSLSLKSIDFCVLKQQECKGYYDKNQIYHIKCESIKCHGNFKYECTPNICSTKKNECKKYIKWDTYLKLINTIRIFDSKLANLEFKKINEIKSFKKDLKDCHKKKYEFTPTDFCVNSRNCIEIREYLKGFGFNYRRIITSEKIYCQCPKSQSFKCGKYCATHSIACDYYKSNEKQFFHIKHCGNYNITTTYKSMNYI